MISFTCGLFEIAVRMAEREGEKKKSEERKGGKGGGEKRIEGYLI